MVIAVLAARAAARGRARHARQVYGARHAHHAHHVHHVPRAPRSSSHPARAATLLAALALAGCTSAEPAGAGVVAGDYNGMLAVQHRDQLRSIFGSLHLRIGGDGELIQSELVTTSPTSVIGERGPATGMVIARDSVANDADLTLAFPTLGTYHLTGTLLYADTTRALSGMLTTRDDSGAVIGTTLIAVMK